MAVGRRRLAQLWALGLALAWAQHTGHAHYGSTDSSYEYYTDLPTVQPGPGGDPLGGVTIFPPLKTVPVVRALNPAHNGRVCSMWGNFHYKTFDGAIFRFPGLCNYVLASHCRAAYEDFNIQVRRSQEANATTPSKVVMKLDGMVLELTKASVLVNGHPVQLPFSQSGVLIEKSNMYLKVVARLGLVFMWNLDDSLLLELDDKYANQTCGLCGDFNGLSVFNEFLSNNVKLTPTEYGNLQKLDGPMEQCQDPAPTPMRNCTTGLEFCQGILLSQPFSGCHDLVDTSSYIEACQQDICLCADTDPTNCSCPTLAEYARQCVHAGGVPQDWRTSDLCPAQACPFNMEHHECGLPCPNTCSNLEHAQLCEDHCISGCFCPQGMVLDDITQNGCVAVDHCSCMYNGLSYAPGDVYSTDCANCTCSGGRWNCQDTPCPGTCSVLGGSHFSTFDEKQYTVHGDCSYVLAKPCDSSVFTVLAELRKCGLTDSETCLKSVTLSLGGGQTVIMVKASNEVFVNQIYTKLPVSAANITLFKPSTFFIIAQTNLGLQLDIQLVPTMQVFLRLAPELRGLTCGLCGNFNSIQADDFQTISGVVEGTAAAFFNTWKTQASCPNVKNSFEDPCSLSVENEKYAQYWCSQLMDAKGPFALCHASVNPATYYSNCLFDTCNCEKSEDCLCAALSAYVHTCAAKGVLLRSWRDGACTKPMTTCPESLTYRDYVSTCQPTCRSLSEEDVICHISFVPVDGCVCAEDTYLDDSGKCVPAASCPCYYGGSPVLSGESVHDGGAVCTCNQGKLTCIGGHTPTPVCAAPMVYFDCQNITSRAAGASCQKSCHTLDMACYSSPCISGCVCPDGLVSDGEGGCVAETECPCVHNEASYTAGQAIHVGCNTCTCKNRMWQCTQEPCLATCAVYGDGHYLTFDGQSFTFDGDCEYTLVQDHCGSNSSAQGSFRVVTENIPCGTTGTTCSKAIKIFLGSYELKLSDGKVEVIEKGAGQAVPYSIRQMGIYLVVDTDVGLILQWDKKTSLFLRLSPEFKGKVCGLCGNFDGNAVNDFTTRSQSVVGDVLEFGNSWKFSPSCPDARAPRNPCTANPYRKSWAQKQCSILHGATFAACHAHVDPTKYYEACVSDACACDSGGDCECFCTAVAAYAQACHDAGVCVSWRSPDVCPLFCDYYNRQGECEWHYQPCGVPCMRTCRNLSGRCLHDVSGLEGCYPRCPPEAPIFDEDKMQCVPQCQTPPPPPPCRVRGKDYRPGASVPSNENCHTCICTENGVVCAYDAKACVCTYDGRHFRPGDVIYNTADGTGSCLSAHCTANGTIERRIGLCNTSTAPTTTFFFSSTPYGTSPVSTVSTVTSNTLSRAPGTSSGSTVSTVMSNIHSTTPGTSSGSTLSNVMSNIRSTAPGTSPVSPVSTVTSNTLSTAPGTFPGSTASTVMSSTLSITPGTSSGSTVSTVTSNTLSTAPGTSPGSPVSTVTSNTLSTAPATSSGSTVSTVTSNTLSTAPATSSGSTVSTVKSNTLSTAPGTSPGSTASTVMSNTLSTAPGTFPGSPVSTVTSNTLSTAPGTSPSPGCGEVCQWTPWLEVSHPGRGVDSGDFDTLQNLRAHGFRVCQAPREVKCRAENTPNVPLEALGQHVECSRTVGLICYNKDQASGLCDNYQIRILCCSPAPCSTTSHRSALTSTSVTSRTTQTTAKPGTKGISLSEGPSTATSGSVHTASTTLSTASTPPAPGTSTSAPGTSTPIKTSLLTPSPTPETTETTSSTEPSTVACLQEMCKWTKWLDGSYPGPGRNGGDFDTFHDLRAKGYNICEHPKEVECRAAWFPDVPLDELGQGVICNTKVGLLCLNKNQLPPICYNYEIRILCCELVDVCRTTTRVVPPTVLTTATTLVPTTTPTSQRTTTSVSTTSTPVPITSSIPVPRTTVSVPTTGSTPGPKTTIPLPTTTTTVSTTTTIPVSTMSSASGPKTIPVSTTTNSVPTTTNPVPTTSSFPITTTTTPTSITTTIPIPTTSSTPVPTNPIPVDTATTSVRTMSSIPVTTTTTPTSITTTIPVPTTSSTSVPTTTSHLRTTTTPVPRNRSIPVSTTTTPIPTTTIPVPTTSFASGHTTIIPVHTTTISVPTTTTSFPTNRSSSLSTATTLVLKTTTTVPTISSIPVSTNTTPLSTTTTIPVPITSSIPGTTSSTLVSTSTTIPIPRTTSTPFHKMIIPICTTTTPVSTTTVSVLTTSSTHIPTATIPVHTRTTLISTSTTTEPTTTTPIPKTIITAPENSTTPGTTPVTASSSTASTTSVSKTSKPVSKGSSIIPTTTTVPKTPSPVPATTRPVPKTTTCLPRTTNSVPTTTSPATTATTPVPKTAITAPTTTPTLVSTSTTNPVPTTTPIPLSTSTSTTVPETTHSQTIPITCRQQCTWTKWFDVDIPSPGSNGGDVETYDNIIRHGEKVCHRPEEITKLECRAQQHPMVSIEKLGQVVECNSDVGLVCQNRDQTGTLRMCLNYEIRVLCCELHCPPPVTSTSPGTSNVTASSSTASTPSVSTTSKPVSTCTSTVPTSVPTRPSHVPPTTTTPVPKTTTSLPTTTTSVPTNTSISLPTATTPVPKTTTIVPTNRSIPVGTTTTPPSTTTTIPVPITSSIPTTTTTTPVSTTATIPVPTTSATPVPKTAVPTHTTTTPVSTTTISVPTTSSTPIPTATIPVHTRTTLVPTSTTTEPTTTTPIPKTISTTPANSTIPGTTPVTASSSTASTTSVSTTSKPVSTGSLTVPTTVPTPTSHVPATTTTPVPKTTTSLPTTTTSVPTNTSISLPTATTPVPKTTTIVPTTGSIPVSQTTTPPSTTTTIPVPITSSIPTTTTTTPVSINATITVPTTRATPVPKTTVPIHTNTSPVSTTTISVPTTSSTPIPTATIPVHTRTTLIPTSTTTEPTTTTPIPKTIITTPANSTIPGTTPVTASSSTASTTSVSTTSKTTVSTRTSTVPTTTSVPAHPSPVSATTTTVPKTTTSLPTTTSVPTNRSISLLTATTPVPKTTNIVPTNSSIPVSQTTTSPSTTTTIPVPITSSIPTTTTTTSVSTNATIPVPTTSATPVPKTTVPIHTTTSPLSTTTISVPTTSSTPIPIVTIPVHTRTTLVPTSATTEPTTTTPIPKTIITTPANSTIPGTTPVTASSSTASTTSVSTTSKPVSTGSLTVPTTVPTPTSHVPATTTTPVPKTTTSLPTTTTSVPTNTSISLPTVTTPVPKTTTIVPTNSSIPVSQTTTPPSTTITIPVPITSSIPTTTTPVSTNATIPVPTTRATPVPKTTVPIHTTTSPLSTTTISVPTTSSTHIPIATIAAHTRTTLVPTSATTEPTTTTPIPKTIITTPSNSTITGTTPVTDSSSTACTTSVSTTSKPVSTGRSTIPTNAATPTSHVPATTITPVPKATTSLPTTTKSVPTNTSISLPKATTPVPKTTNIVPTNRSIPVSTTTTPPLTTTTSLVTITSSVPTTTTTTPVSTNATIPVPTTSATPVPKTTVPIHTTTSPLATTTISVPTTSSTPIPIATIPVHTRTTLVPTSATTEPTTTTPIPKTISMTPANSTIPGTTPVTASSSTASTTSVLTTSKPVSTGSLTVPTTVPTPTSHVPATTTTPVPKTTTSHPTTTTSVPTNTSISLPTATTPVPKTTNIVPTNGSIPVSQTTTPPSTTTTILITITSSVPTTTATTPVSTNATIPVPTTSATPVPKTTVPIHTTTSPLSTTTISVPTTSSTHIPTATIPVHTRTTLVTTSATTEPTTTTPNTKTIITTPANSTIPGTTPVTATSSTASTTSVSTTSKTVSTRTSTVPTTTRVPAHPSPVSATTTTVPKTTTSLPTTTSVPTNRSISLPTATTPVPKTTNIVPTTSSIPVSQTTTPPSTTTTIPVPITSSIPTTTTPVSTNATIPVSTTRATPVPKTTVPIHTTTTPVSTTTIAVTTTSSTPIPTATIPLHTRTTLIPTSATTETTTTTPVPKTIITAPENSTTPGTTPVTASNSTASTTSVSKTSKPVSTGNSTIPTTVPTTPSPVPTTTTTPVPKSTTSLLMTTTSVPTTTTPATTATTPVPKTTITAPAITPTPVSTSTTPVPRTSPIPLSTSTSIPVSETTHSQTIPITCRQQCTWTKWFDVDFPSPGPNGGDVETYDNIIRHGEKVCHRPEEITKLECRAEKHPVVSIEKLGQVVECNSDVGLVCRNRDQTGTLKMCLNYEIRVLCCELHCPPPVTSTSPGTSPVTATSSTASTTSVSTTSKPVSTGSSTVPTTTTVPTAPSHVPATTTTPVPKSTTSLPITTTSVPTTTTPATTATTPVPKTAITAPETTPTPVSTSTTTPVPTTTPIPLSTSTSTPVPVTTLSQTIPITCRQQCTWTKWFDVDFPSPGPKGGDVETYDNIIRHGEKVCHRPEEITKLECRAEKHPVVSIEKLGQVVECNSDVGLVCRNRDQTGTLKMCLNYEIRVLCCELHCPPPVTSTSPGTSPVTATSSTASTTSVSTTSKPVSTGSSTVPTTTTVPTAPSHVPATTTTPVPKSTTSLPITTTSVPTTTTPATTATTPVPKTAITAPETTPTPVSTSTTTPVPTTTPIPLSTSTSTPVPVTTLSQTIPITCRQQCTWTKWFDVDFPSPGPKGGDVETYDNIIRHGEKVCHRPEEITKLECRAEKHPVVSIEKLGQVVECNSDVGLVCRNRDQTGTLKMCLNYEIRVLCCELHCPPPVTSTSPGTSPVTATSSTASTTSVSTTSKPVSTGSSTVPTTTTVPTAPSHVPATTTTPVPKSTTSLPITTTSVPTTTTPATTATTPVPKTAITAPETTPTPVSTSTTTPVPTTTPIPLSMSTSTPVPVTTLSQTIPITCWQQCTWTKWFDVDFPSPGPKGGDVETYDNIIRHGEKVCHRPEEITKLECRAKKYPVVSIENLGQVVECNSDVGLVCRNRDQTGTLKMCLNYEIRVLCCELHCPPPVTSTSPGTSPVTATSSTASTTSVLTTSKPVSTGGSTIPTSKTVPTTPSSVPTTTPVLKSTTSVPKTAIPASIPTPTSLPTTTSVSVPTTTTPPISTTTPISVSITISTLLPETTHFQTITTICPKECTWSKWFDVDFPSPGAHGGDVETYDNIIRHGQKVCHRPEEIMKLECRAENHPVVSIEKLGQVVECNPDVGLVCRNRDQIGTVKMCLNYEIRVLCCQHHHGCPQASVPPNVTSPTAHTVPPVSTSVTSTRTLLSPVTNSTTVCYCVVDKKFYPAGSIIYQKTDLDGHCFYSQCSQDCHVVKNTSSNCPPTTPSPTPATSPSSGCSDLVPPRKKGETWNTPNCTQVTCEGHNVTSTQPVKCPSIREPTCANGYPPLKVADADGCCYHYNCQCICSGWGDPHYITFDGTYYTFLDNCTYVLVQQIVPEYGHFRVLIDNYFCDAEDGLSCPQSIIVEYQQDRVVLTHKPGGVNISANQIIFNNKEVRPGFRSNGIIVSQVGIKMYVSIPTIGLQVMFTGLIFSVEVPFSKFANNTEGQCGICSNDQKDDCRLPGGGVTTSCSKMSNHWKVTNPDQPYCYGLSPTPLPTTSSKLQTSPTPCPPAPICQLILSKVFELCHKVIPPWPYYEGCVFDHCHMRDPKVACSSLEIYASLCASQHVCIDWRGLTNNTCPFTCPVHQVYQPCGPVNPTYCYGNNTAVPLPFQDPRSFTEGCFCGEGLMLFSPSTPVCVPTNCQQCLGPSGEPVEPGQTITNNCQECTCDSSTQTLACRAQTCPPAPDCHSPGHVLVHAPLPAIQCCPEYQCVCNTSSCPQLTPCPKGSHFIETHQEGECCLSQKCIYDVCVVNGSLYQPGAVVSSGLCETCRCQGTEDPETDPLAVICEIQICQSNCPVGFQYLVPAGQCCGSCVQVACVMYTSNGSAHLFYPGETWSEPGKPCETHECEKHKDELVVVTTRKACPVLQCPQNQALPDEDGCCLSCPQQPPQNASTCAVYHKQEVVRDGGCSSTQPVRLAYCQGNCGDTASMYSFEANMVEHRCRCCQELRTSLRNVTLSCRDGSTRAFSYHHIEECGCVGPRCDALGSSSHSESEPEQSEGEER